MTAAPHTESLYARDDASVAGRAYRKSASGARGPNNSGNTGAVVAPPPHQPVLGKGAWPAAMAPRTRRYDVPRFLYLIAAKGHRARRKEMQMTRYERVVWRALRDPSRFEARLHS